MSDISNWETAVRLGVFAGVFLLLMVWELFRPRRRLRTARPARWSSNLALVAINSLLVRLIAPLGLVGIAWFAESNRWGLFSAVQVPGWVAFLVSVILLDLTLYLQHVLFHAVPLLWRLHMVHHADLDFDVTTGLRFHTLEILLSFGLKAAAILLLGAPAVSVLTFEILLNATSLFNHSNVRMPPRIDRLLRTIVVTPDMHRVHHSTISRETNSNFGFNLPWWDYLLGTYRSQPQAGHEHMTIGLETFDDEHRVDRLPGMLLLPLARQTGDYPVNRRDAESDERSRRG